MTEARLYKTTEPEQKTTEHAKTTINKFYGYGGVHKCFEKPEKTGESMYTELYKLGLYPDNNGVEIGGFKYNASLNMLESKNGEHTVIYEGKNKFTSIIENVRTMITVTLKDALLDYLKFKHEQEKKQSVIVNTLEHDIKVHYDVDENDYFADNGYLMKIKTPHMAKVVNLDVWLVKKSMKYYITGHYSDGTYHETSTMDLKKAIKELCDYAVRTRP